MGVLPPVTYAPGPAGEAYMQQDATMQTGPNSELGLVRKPEESS